MKPKTIKSCTTYQVNLKTRKEQIYSRQHFRTDSEMELAEFYNESEKCFLKNKYTFDERGNNIEDILFEKGQEIKKWVHFHNEKNQHIETHFHDEDGLTGYYEYRFNEKGECIEELEYDNIKCLEMRTVYQYNAQSRMIEEACFDADNHLFEKTTTSYNAKNRIVFSMDTIKPSLPIFNDRERYLGFIGQFFHLLENRIGFYP